MAKQIMDRKDFIMDEHEWHRCIVAYTLHIEGWTNARISCQLKEKTSKIVKMIESYKDRKGLNND